MTNATPPKFGTAPIEEDDDLFNLTEYVCADCKQTFETSRHSLRCARCRSLRQGQVGPAQVTCPICDKEHKVSVLAPHRLCPDCALDLDATERHIRETLATAEQTLTDAWQKWDTNLAHSGETEWWQRVSTAQFAVDQGQMPQAEFDRKVATTIKQGGIRATLWKQSQAVEALVKVTETTRAWAEAALEEVMAAR